MYIGKNPSPLTVTEKRVRRNPKYAHVKGHLDTGASSSKVKLMSTKEFLKRRSEIFKRIRPSEVARLISSDFTLSYPNANSIIDEENPELEQKSMESDSECMLLLDMRTREEYEACHIKQAKHFSIVGLHQDRYIPELYRFKNVESKMIVVYDEDEKLAAEAATSLNQKGYENIRLMTGL
uniref:Rhodanese domain-containing protein n=1 Tax=Aplanochytrium stocchinoi TaxID=215587 RepID=A0A7S3LR57_9STRA